jgi:hypothetical protein
MENKITFTETGKEALHQYLEVQKKYLERSIASEKNVFGDDEIEITSSDIKLFIDGEILKKRKKEDRIRLLFILNIYIIIGILSFLVGMFYPLLIEMFKYNPFQFSITVIGILLTLCGVFIRLYLQIKK